MTHTLVTPSDSGALCEQITPEFPEFDDQRLPFRALLASSALRSEIVVRCVSIGGLTGDKVISDATNWSLYSPLAQRVTNILARQSNL